MNYEQLQNLIQSLDKSSLAYLSYRADDVDLVLSKEVPTSMPCIESATIADSGEKAHHSLDIATSKNSLDDSDEHLSSINSNQAAESEVDAGQYVESPMVGVAYLQPQPEAEVFVNVGDYVEAGDVVCIIEAMKLMNEIQSPISGVVSEILIENEQVVEFNQPLFRIQPHT